MLHLCKEGNRATLDKLKELNLDTSNDPYSILSVHVEKEECFKLLIEYINVFASTCKEMPELDLKVIGHHFPVKHDLCPIKQSVSRFRLKLVLQIVIEVNKLIEVNFIRQFKYLASIVNIVPVKKRMDKLKFVLILVFK